jgi:hypothetical protein
MTGTVIDSDGTTPRLVYVTRKLVFCALDFGGKDGLDKGVGVGTGLLVPVFECSIAVSHGLLNGRGLFKKLMQFTKIRLKYFEFENFDGSTDRFTLY